MSPLPYRYFYKGGKLSYMDIGDTKLYFSYDASGLPMSVTYGNAEYYYSLNLQGDVVAILNSSGATVVEYTYDAWGNILSITGTMASDLGAHNPLRYRGYVYDTETKLYYLQSRYYDPEIGRFINADSLMSADQDLLGCNIFAYCANNPINYIDPNGHKFVGYGFQFEIQIGDISYGFEIIIYKDPIVCGGKDYLVASYCYTGYDVSLGEIQGVVDIAETLITTFAFETDCTNVEMFYSAVTFIYNGAGVSGGAFILYGDDDFDDPGDYSGGFETWSLSIKVKSATVTFFHSFSDKCDAYGVKIGAHFDGLRPRVGHLLGATYSRSDYSDPYIWGD